MSEEMTDTETVCVMREALIMVRDADDDCKKDGKPAMPSLARKKIDDAIKRAEHGINKV